MISFNDGINFYAALFARCIPAHFIVYASLRHAIHIYIRKRFRFDVLLNAVTAIHNLLIK